MDRFQYYALILTALTLTGCAILDSAAGSQASYEAIHGETLDALVEERRESFVLINAHI